MSTTDLHITREDTGEVLTDRERWLQERRKGIGGSDAASLFPEDTKYGCTLKLWYEKRGQKPDYERTQAEQKILGRGNRMEDMVASAFTSEYGFKVRKSATRVMKGVEHMRVNIDRQIINVTTEEIHLFWPQLEKELQGPCGPGVLECKTANDWVFRDIIKNGAPLDYVLQVQHGLAVTGYRWGIMAVLNTSTFELLVFPMVRNESLIGMMLERAGLFWPIVENGPQPDAPDFPKGDRRCLGCSFRKTCRGTLYLLALAGEKPDTDYVPDDSFAELASDLRDIRNQLETLEQTEETIIGRIQQEMLTKGESKIEVPSVGARIRWAEQKGAVRYDTKALDAEGGTIARHASFAAWVAENYPDFLTFWLEHKARGQHFHIADKYKRPGAPSRPFHFVNL